MSLQKTISFKLIMDKTTNEEFDAYFLEFGKAVNFFLKNMHKIRSSFVNIPKKEQKEDICEVCKNKALLIKKNSSPNTFNFFINEKTKNKLKNLVYESDKIYKILPGQSICSYCCGFIVSDNFIRKQLYPERKKRLKLFADVRNSSRLTGTEFAMAFEQAKAILKSQKEQQKYIGNRIKFLRYILLKNLEVLEDKEIEVEEEIDDKTMLKKVKARILIPAETKRHKDKFKHYMDNEKYKGKTINSIQNSIEKVKNQIQKLEKRILSFPYFNSKVIQLHMNSLAFMDGNNIKIVIGGRKFELPFYGTDVKNEKGSERFKEALENIKKHKMTYSHIIKRNNEFYLEYPMIIDSIVPEFDESFNAMGIDRGVKKILAYVIINSKGEFLAKPDFFRGEDLMKSRIKYRNIIRRLRGIRRKNRKMREFGGKVKNISKDLVQKISREVVDIAKNKMPIVIVMEDLKGLKEPSGKKKYKKEARLRFMINTFIYGQIQKAVEYKAKEEGIPFDYIEARHTSQKCSKCGDIRKENRKTQGYFKCKNCGFQMNADLNAALNIANKFYEKFK